jgi:hypothetical protein
MIFEQIAHGPSRLLILKAERERGHATRSSTSEVAQPERTSDRSACFWRPRQRQERWSPLASFKQRP